MGESLSTTIPAKRLNQVINTPKHKPVEIPITKKNSYAFLLPEIVPKKRNKD